VEISCTQSRVFVPIGRRSPARVESFLRQGTSEVYFVGFASSNREMMQSHWRDGGLLSCTLVALRQTGTFSNSYDPLLASSRYVSI